ncbi:MAG: outer membrane beta-barrel protein [Mesorhizobium sp.]|nr:outer membrane beta-barrel protein [Mesorhizobium sp.]MBN9242934.1 outer membrane beta-barrel protein [Mesorhizobium sp.]
MSHAEPRFPRRRRRKAACALLLAAVAWPSVLAAQETGLSAATDASAPSTNNAAAPGQTRQKPASGAASAAAAAAAVPAYQPVSPGAVPDAPAPAAANADDGSPLADDGTSLTDDGSADDSAGTTPTTSALPTRRPASKVDAAADDTPQPTNERQRTIDYADRQPLDPRADRTAAIETPRPKPEDDPFAPVGIPFGTFVLRPSIEQGLTATSNANNAPGGTSAVLSETTLRLNATSDWASNSATIDALGNLRESLSGASLHDASGSINGTLNLDLENEWRATAKAGYEIAPESASSPVVIGDVASQPTRQSFDGSLAISKDIGKLRFGLTGAAARDTYGDASLLGGGVLSQKDRNETLYTTTLRGGYAISPALTPFAEVEVGRRLYDQRIDDDGYQRSANRLGIRAGTELDLGEKLNGEISAGWLSESPDDARLAAISGASVNADLKWSPERGTVIGLAGTTTVEGTTTPGETGDLLYSGQLTAERRIRSDLTANAALGLGWRTYTGTDGHDMIMSAEAGLTWWLNRYVGLSTKARYEKLESNLPGRNYDSASIFAGIKVQR